SSCLLTAWVTGHSRLPVPPARMMPLRAISAPFAQPLQAVLAVEDPLRPGSVGKVPVDRGRQAVLEAGGRGPAQLTADLASTDRVAAVVAGPVAHEGD